MSRALEIAGASKAFDARPALRRASFACDWGEVHALLGENGAGKSTLMNVACGLYAPDEGTIAVDGQPAAITAPADAASLGIGMVHQHYKLVQRFTVAENIVLACRDALGVRRPRDAAEAVGAKAADVGFEIDPNAVVGALSIAEQQRVEILKVLLLGARILILDEPTSVLTDQESVQALTFMRRLADDGHAVVLITHKLREMIGYSSRVTVMRGGEYGSLALVRRGAMKAAAAASIDTYSIHGAAPGTPARLLSGGNAQKLLLARELRGEASVLIAHSPTRGLDVSACRTVHNLLQGAADAGAACVLISEDLEEVLALSTTIAVISRGRLVGAFAAGEVSRAEIGRLMLGHA